MTYEDDVADNEANVGWNHADTGKLLDFGTVRGECDLFITPRTSLLRGVGHLVAGENRQQATKQDASCASREAVLKEGVRDRQCTRAQANDDEREDGRIHGAFAHLRLDEAPRAACHVENALARRHRRGLSRHDMLLKIRNSLPLELNLFGP